MRLTGLTLLLTKGWKMSKMGLVAFQNEGKDMEAGGGAGERYERHD